MSLFERMANVTNPLWHDTRDDLLVCPRCGCKSVETKCMGWFHADPSEFPFADPNGAKCSGCGHRGNSGDWRRIQQLRIEASGPGTETRTCDIHGTSGSTPERRHLSGDGRR